MSAPTCKALQSWSYPPKKAPPMGGAWVFGIEAAQRLYVEAYALGQGQGRAVVDGVGLPAHVVAPGV